MAIVRPFRGVRFAPERVGEPGSVTCPPYDVMDAAAQRRFHDQNPYNAVRLELPSDAPGDDDRVNRYTRAAQTLTAWRQEGILRRDEDPALYRYAQSFEDATGAERVRTGVLAVLRLEEFASGVVLPHEETFPHHKEDRFRLLSACKTQISPIFGLFPSPRPELWRSLAARPEPPAVDFLDEDGVRHQLTPLTDSTLLDACAADLRDARVFIADGHHRYETALRYRAERRAAQGAAGDAWFDYVGDAWFDYVMILLVEMGDRGLAVFPTHRLVRLPGPIWERAREILSPHFRIEAFPVSSGPGGGPALEERAARGTLVLLAPGADAALALALAKPDAMARAAPERSPAWRSLDVAVLHRLLLPRLEEAAGTKAEVAYTRDPEAALVAARRGEAGAVFVAGATVDDLRAVSLAGERMPEKSTFFFPKARTGLVLHGEAGGPDADL
jgi:uncharacterized protein (DUF1015 family)